MTDGASQTATCSFDVVVTDIEAPTITCPADVGVNNDAGLCGATVTYDAPSIADNCDNLGLTLSFVSGGDNNTFFAVGTSTVTWRVTDAAGLTADCSFSVTVTDAEAPVVSCPKPMEF